MVTRIREWSDVEFSIHHTDHDEMQRMAKHILANADTITNEPTPGHSDQNLSRVITAKSSIFPGTEYIIHTYGFRVEHITEIVEA